MKIKQTPKKKELIFMISMTSKTYFSSLFPYLNSLYACKIVKTSHELLY